MSEDEASMRHHIDFKRVFLLLKEWFDLPTPSYHDFESWRRQTYRDLDAGRIANPPLKIWWPIYTEGDSQLEQCVGALLVQQVSWSYVRICIENISSFLKQEGKVFDLEGLLSIPGDELENLIRPSRFFEQKAERLIQFCQFVKDDAGTITRFFQSNAPPVIVQKLTNLKAGFGNETRDCVLLYNASCPVFVADEYARKLLRHLGFSQSISYITCQKIFQEGIQRDFGESDLQLILNNYTPEERRYVLRTAPPHKDAAFVLLYQQFHAGIDELGISGRWEEFAEQIGYGRRAQDAGGRFHRKVSAAAT